MVHLEFLQADMFSIGIIQYELYQSFLTEMERIEVLKDLRNGAVPPKFTERWPVQVSIIITTVLCIDYIVMCQAHPALVKRVQ